MRLGHDARDGAAVARNHHGLPGLYIIEELGQMRFSLGFLDFAHGGIPLVRMVGLTGRPMPTRTNNQQRVSPGLSVLAGALGLAQQGIARQPGQSNGIPASRNSGSVACSSARITGPMRRRWTNQRREPGSHTPPARRRI